LPVRHGHRRPGRRRPGGRARRRGGGARAGRQRGRPLRPLGPARAADLAAQPEVGQILADRTYQIPRPLPGQAAPKVKPSAKARAAGAAAPADGSAGAAAVEWNLDRIGAPQAWASFGARGDGVVVATIDTGVLFTHPALVRQYRGNLGNGAFDHDYSWF